MNNKLPSKISLVVDGKKGIYRHANPKMVIAVIFPIIIALPIITGIMILFFDTTVSKDTFLAALSFALSIVALIFSICLHFDNIVTRTYDKASLFYARVEKIKVTKKSINITVKNIGSAHILDAGINDLKINEQYVPQNVSLNFLPVDGTVTFSDHLSCRCASIKKLAYKIYIVQGSTVLMLSCEQEMQKINGEYIIKNNTCIITRRTYHKWWI